MEGNPNLALSIQPQALSVCRLNSSDSIPKWALKSQFYSLVKTADELSIVCSTRHVPAKVKCEKGWGLLKVEGPLDFSLTGILASLAVPLAKHRISIFAISTFDTDYLLVKKNTMAEAIKVLSNQGFKIIK